MLVSEYETGEGFVTPQRMLKYVRSGSARFEPNAGFMCICSLA